MRDLADNEPRHYSGAALQSRLVRALHPTRAVTSPAWCYPLDRKWYPAGALPQNSDGPDRRLRRAASRVRDSGRSGRAIWRSAIFACCRARRRAGGHPHRGRGAGSPGRRCSDAPRSPIQAAVVAAGASEGAACRMAALVLLTADEHDHEQAILLTPTRNTNQGEVGEGITRCALF